MQHQQGCEVLVFVGLRLRLQDLLCNVMIVDDLREILNSSNKRCVIVNRVLVVKEIAQKSNRLQQNYTKGQLKQVGPGVR